MAKSPQTVGHDLRTPGTSTAKEIGVRTKLERKRIGISQAELARKMNTVREVIGRYERGIHATSAACLKVLDSLGADVHYIITGKRRPKTHPAAGIPQSILNLKIDVARLQSFQTISVRELIMIAEYSASQEAD